MTVGAARPLIRVAASRDLKIETVGSVAELRALRDPWNGLVRRSQQNIPFLTHEWLTTWWDAFRGNDDRQVVTVWRGEQLVGVAPMSYSRVTMAAMPFRVAKLWSNPYSNRTQLIIGEPAGAVVGALVDHWLEQDPTWDVICLEPVPLGCAITRVLVSELHARNIPYGVRESLRSPFLPLPATWPELLQGVSGGFRKSLRRSLRRARSEGRLRTRIVNQPEEVEAALAIAKRGRFHDEGTSIASTEAQRQFYRRFARVAARKGWLALAFLDYNDRPIAFEYNLYYEGVMYSLKSGYDPDFAHLSPGHLLTRDVLQRVIKVGGHEYDFLGMDESYKRRWTPQARHHGRITVFSNRLLPRAQHFLSYRMQPWIRTNLTWTVKVRRLARQWLAGRASPDGSHHQ